MNQDRDTARGGRRRAELPFMLVYGLIVFAFVIAVTYWPDFWLWYSEW